VEGERGGWLLLEDEGGKRAGCALQPSLQPPPLHPQERLGLGKTLDGLRQPLDAVETKGESTIIITPYLIETMLAFRALGLVYEVRWRQQSSAPAGCDTEPTARTERAAAPRAAHSPTPCPSCPAHQVWCYRPGSDTPSIYATEKELEAGIDRCRRKFPNLVHAPKRFTDVEVRRRGNKARTTARHGVLSELRSCPFCLLHTHTTALALPNNRRPRPSVRHRPPADG
jgi:hypothetical protein